MILRLQAAHLWEARWRTAMGKIGFPVRPSWIIMPMIPIIAALPGHQIVSNDQNQKLFNFTYFLDWKN